MGLAWGLEFPGQGLTVWHPLTGTVCSRKAMCLHLPGHCKPQKVSGWGLRRGTSQGKQCIVTAPAPQYAHRRALGKRAKHLIKRAVTRVRQTRSPFCWRAATATVSAGEPGVREASRPAAMYHTYYRRDLPKGPRQDSILTSCRLVH